jgi:hypothetical protein
MDAKNIAKTKIKDDFKQIPPQLEKMDEPIKAEMILTENKQNQSKSIADRNRHSITCEAVNCYSKADTEVYLKVGTKGMISLFLCTNCKSKLLLDDTTEKRDVRTRKPSQ